MGGDRLGQFLSLQAFCYNYTDQSRALRSVVDKRYESYRLGSPVGMRMFAEEYSPSHLQSRTAQLLQASAAGTEDHG